MWYSLLYMHIWWIQYLWWSFIASMKRKTKEERMMKIHQITVLNKCFSMKQNTKEIIGKCVYSWKSGKFLHLLSFILGFLEWKDWEDYSLGNLFIFSLCTKRRTNTESFPRPGTILTETHTKTMTESNRNDQTGFSSTEIRELMKNDLGLCYSLPCSINSKCNDTHCFVFLTLIFEIYWIQ